MKPTNSRLKALYGYSDDAPTPSPTPLTLIVGSLGVNFLYFYIVLPTYSAGDNESTLRSLYPHPSTWLQIMTLTWPKQKSIDNWYHITEE